MKVHCIGHSLGAHVCGYAGKEVKLKRISGLDPAGPRFMLSNQGQRIDKNDAELVDIIYTDAGKLSLGSSVGHMNFFPNSGSNQPGCEIQTTIGGVVANEMTARMHVFHFLNLIVNYF